MRNRTQVQCTQIENAKQPTTILFEEKKFFFSNLNFKTNKIIYKNSNFFHNNDKKIVISKEFHEWLESIRETLGPEKYRIWLENVRSQTSHSKKFQDWLPIPLPIENDYNQNLNQYNDFESKINDMEGEILSVFPKTRLDDTFEVRFEYYKIFIVIILIN